MLPDSGNNILNLNHRGVLFADKSTNKDVSMQIVQQDQISSCPDVLA